MKVNEVHEKLKEDVETPVTRDDLVDQCRGIEIDCPTGEPTPLNDLLDRDGAATYDSLQEIHETLMGNLGESHVGRKYYDDRGPNYGTEEVSF